MPQTIHDLKFLFWLNLKHAKSSLRRFAFIFATDIVKDKDLGERLYQLYAFALLALCLFLLWVAALDFFIGFFVALDSSVAASLLEFCPLVPIIAFLYTGYAQLKSCPLRLQHSDIAHLAASHIQASTLLSSQVVIQLFSNAIFSLLVFYFLGSGIEAGLRSFFNPLAFSVTVTLFLVCAFLLSRIISILRFRGEPQKQLRNKALGIILYLLFTFILFAVFAFSFLSHERISAHFYTDPLLSVLLPCAVIIVGTIILFALSRKVVMLWVIESNSYFAEISSLRGMAFIESQTYVEIKRKKKLARRNPWKFCRIGSGFATFITRDILSLGRQYEGLAILIIWGASVTPFAVLLALGTQTPLLWIIVIQILVAFPKGVRESTQIYRNDMHNRMFRHLLPYDPLALLIRDALPSFIVLSAASLAGILLLTPLGVDLFQAMVLSILLNVIFTLCAGLDEVRFFTTDAHISYELSVLISLLLFAGCSLFVDTGFILVAATTIIAAILAFLLKHGSELD